MQATLASLGSVCVAHADGAVLQSAVTPPSGTRQLSDAWRDQSRFLYYNANDPRILVGDFELRRFGVRTINAGHPLLLPYLCLSNIVGSVVTAPVAGDTNA